MCIHKYVYAYGYLHVHMYKHSHKNIFFTQVNISTPAYKHAYLHAIKMMDVSQVVQIHTNM